jgi:hypothetical protein
VDGYAGALVLGTGTQQGAQQALSSGPNAQANGPYIVLANSNGQNPAFTLTNGFGVSSADIAAGNAPFPIGTFNVPAEEVGKVKGFCSTCSFASWGSWSAQSARTPGSDIQHANAFGWWIKGNVIPHLDMPTRGGATYAGSAIGNVITPNAGYVATGKLDMAWSFAARTGAMSITNFDGKNFVGVMQAPSSARSQFSGQLFGANPAAWNMRGVSTGAFVAQNGVRTAPQGIIGNFGVGNNSWRATGIYGGGLTGAIGVR